MGILAATAIFAGFSGAGCVHTPGSLLLISNADGDQELYLYDGASVTRLTENGYDDLQASWSADGRQVLFTSNIAGNPEIVRYDRTTGALRQLTDSPGLDAWPRLSPDGTRICFISTRGDYEGLYTMSADGHHVKVVLPGTPAAEPRWSPDGQKIAFFTASEEGVSLAWTDPAGKQLRLLTEPSDALYNLSFSPDGRHLLYAARRSKNVDIYTYELASGTEKRLTTDHWIDAEPAWSPRGDQIVWLSARDDTTRRQLYLMDANGNNQRRVSSSGVEEMHPRWSPDGSQLAYVAYYQRRFVLHIMDIDSGLISRLDDQVLGGYQFQPEYNPISKRVWPQGGNTRINLPHSRLSLSSNGGGA